MIMDKLFDSLTSTIESALCSALDEPMSTMNVFQHIDEMATIAKPNWDNIQFRIAIHGPSAGDIPSPHIHIYLLQGDNDHKLFNFEVSLIDLLIYDEVILSRQLDKRGRENIDFKNREECSWQGYSEIKNNLIRFLNGADNKLYMVSAYKKFKNGLEALVAAYNNESDGDCNMFAKFFIDKGLKPSVLPQYQYLLDDNFSV